jgi:hypothetical protein
MTDSAEAEVVSRARRKNCACMQTELGGRRLNISAPCELPCSKRGSQVGPCWKLVCIGSKAGGEIEIGHKGEC